MNSVPDGRRDNRFVADLGLALLGRCADAASPAVDDRVTLGAQFQKLASEMLL